MSEKLLPPLHDPLVSVMIVNYNYERFLPEAIESVLRQTYQKFEIIICDDGSKDNSRDVISRYVRLDRRIKPIFQENGGVGTALNSTYSASSGEIISMLDADDIFEPEKLARVVGKFVSGGRVGTVVNALTKVDSEGKVIGRIPQFGSLDRGELRDRLLQSAAHWSVAPTSGVSFRRECAEHVFPIPAQQFRTEVDGYMCTIAPLYYAVDVIDEPMTIYRVHSSNVTAVSAIDAKYCDRVMNAGERVFAALSARAAEEGWAVTKLEHNPTYCEMRVIRDVLTGARFGDRQKHLQELREAAARVETADRSKTKAKSAILSLTSFLPKPAARKLIDAIYLPNRLKSAGSRLLRRTRKVPAAG
ncbi:MAG: glycosyltransferase [Verrucomicrobiota bacterium]|nr:glycosyltransferase [Verrucomicrobiota bacterium]